jgi:ribosomal protein S18 acetylase RimI-like enzyme
VTGPKRAWTIRPFAPGQDDAGLVKLLHAVATFDGGVEAWSRDLLTAWIGHPRAEGGSLWRVAVAKNDSILGALLVFVVGSTRAEVVVAVNPAFRRQGIGRALLDIAPRDKRLQCKTRKSVGGATALLESAGFEERHRLLRMRREATPVLGIRPEGAALATDARKDARRAILALTAVLGDDADDDRALMKARLARPRTSVVYLELDTRSMERADSRFKTVDGGICMVGPSDRTKKGERTAAGEPIVGVIEVAGLQKNLRGKGLSRALVRAGMQAVVDEGFRWMEATADTRRAAAVELYEREGFEAVDEDIEWIRNLPS